MNSTSIIKKLLIFLLFMLSTFVFFLVFPYFKIIISIILKIVLPFFISFAIAYVLQPLVLFFQKFLKKRYLAVMTVLAFIIGITATFLYIAVPLINKEINNLVENLPKILNDFENIINKFASSFDFLPENYQPTLENLKTFFSSYITKLSSLPSRIIKSIFDYIGVIVVIPASLVYLLLDYEKFLCKVRDFLIEKKMITLKNYLGELNKNIMQYVKGTFLVLLIIAFISALTFMFIGLDYAIFFGIIIAITDIIPYIGPYLGAIPPVCYALLISPKTAITVIIAIVIIQVLESNLITPYIQSKNMETHPLLVIFALLVFGSLFGIIGMILAVPALIILKTSYKYLVIRKEEKNSESSKETSNNIS